MSVIHQMTTRAEILQVLRSLVRVAREYPDYNMREYIKRRTIDGFRNNNSLSEPSSIDKTFADAKYQLEVAKRQAVVYSLYSPKLGSIMDLPVE